MNPDRAGFLRAIRSSPHDYPNYLVFADWLQEHGDESDQWFAESMRLRAEKEILVEQEDARWRQKEIRLNEIEVNRPKLPKGLKYFDLWGKDSFIRGDLSAILKHGGELIDRWLIGSCFIDKVDSSIEKLCNQSWIRELGALGIHDSDAYATAATQLIQGSEFSSLKKLDLSFLPFDQNFWENISKTRSFPILEELVLHSYEIDGRLMNQLGNSNNFPCLKELTLSALQLSSPILFADFLSSRLATQLEQFCIRSENFQHHSFFSQAVVESSALVNLRVLDFSTLPLNDELLIQFCRNPHFPNLETLEFLGLPQMFRHLAEATLLPNLRNLHLHARETETDGLQLFCDSFPWKGEGFGLFMRFLRLGDEGGKMLANAKKLAGLKSLTLYKSDIGPEGTCAIAESPYLRDLEWLFLDGESTANRGRRAILGASWPNLKSIGLSRTQLDDSDLRFLAEHGNMPRLRRILIHENPITEEGITCLMNSNRFPMLEEIDVSGLQFRDDFESEVRQRGYRLVREY
jgi:uncharacterized protein (TIGR02996 family)